MSIVHFLIRAGIYFICFVLSWYGMGAVHYEKILKKNRVQQAQVLYFLIVIALAYLSGSFIIAFLYTF